MSQPAARERVFSGIQPSGASHLGNYLGAQVNYVALQESYEAIYGIVDLHAMTTVHDGEQLRRLSHDMVLDLLAIGLDPDRSALIRQSDLPEHAELCWIFNTVVPVSWLERNPTYKEKRQDGIDNSNALLTYPVLQAADIVIYKATRVPVGKDQAAHLELSREIVRAHGGEITVRSEVGQGSTFTVTLPVPRGEAVVELPPSTAPEPDAVERLGGQRG